MATQVQKMMKLLGISEAEAVELIATDKRIDKGEKLFELPEELKAGAKKARRADRKPTNYNFSKRERKTDNIKLEITSRLVELITKEIADSGSVEVANPEREFSFTHKGKKYKITLACPRS